MTSHSRSPIQLTYLEWVRLKYSNDARYDVIGYVGKSGSYTFAGTLTYLDRYLGRVDGILNT